MTMSGSVQFLGRQPLQAGLMGLSLHRSCLAPTGPTGRRAGLKLSATQDQLSIPAVRANEARDLGAPIKF